ncbi:hypothetical protein GGG16DRAFT_86244 [Schizophyllum commune]
MSSTTVPLSSVALSPNIADIPVVEHIPVKFNKELDYQYMWTLEWNWGLPRGQLPLESSLNRLEMRSDMLQPLRELDWMLMPTSETLNKMIRLLKHNARAKASSRKDIMKVLSAHEHEYELRYMRVREGAEQPTIYVRNGTAAPDAFEYPYHGLPKVTSRAHPLFVTYMVERATMHGIHPVNDRDLKALHIATANVARLWLNEPPTEFKYGPDFPSEHRHPISVAGLNFRRPARKICKTDDSPIEEKDKGCSSNSDSRSTPTSTSLGKRKRDTADDGGSPRLSPRALASASDKCLYDDHDALRAWADSAEFGDPNLRSTSPSLTEEADAALSRYTQESFRSPRHVMRSGRRLPEVSFPIYQERDSSRFSSTQWAEWKYHILLWGTRNSSRLP